MKMRYTVEDICQMAEGQTFDCKSIRIEPKALANTIVAMANADGGMIAVGITDKSRRIEGVDQEQDRLNEILRTPFDFCVPTVSVTTEFLPCKDSEGRDNHILIFIVPASPRLHANQADEVFWRVGDKSRKLSFEERLQLMYDKGERYYEDSPAYDATIEDIDMDAVRAYVKRVGYGKSPIPKIAEYLKAYDYVKEFGEGVDRMCRELSAVGTKDPEYHLVSFLMKATVWANVLEDGQITNSVGANGSIMDQKRPESDQKSDQKSDQMHQILDLIKRNPKISRAELSEKTGLHDSSVKRRLKALVDEGFIQRIGPDKGGYWQLLK